MATPRQLWSATAPLLFLAAAAAGADPPRKVELTLVDPQAHGYATFQSHNQKVVANRHGIFMTHIRSRNEAYTAQQWRLSRSTDNGQTFTTIFAATDATNPPVIESDAEGNLYLIRPDFLDGHAYLYQFRASTGFREPVITRIPNGSGGKFAAAIDESRKRLYYLSNNGSLYALGLDGQIEFSVQLLAAGPSAHCEYPHLFVTPQSVLHAAWTTTPPGVYLYWDIHHVRSPDGGATWRNFDGSRLSPPIVVDQTGPAARISLDDEFEAHTWLSNFTVQENKVHFLYLTQAQPPRQHYMRYDLATGKRDIDIQPEFRGESLEIFTVDGFFASDPHRSDSPLYCVGRDKAGRIICLVSRDRGHTWRDYAASDETFHAYSIGGFRQITHEGYIVGSFTDSHGSTAVNDQKSKVYFLRIRAAAGPAVGE